jgi:hypothetical protein
MSQEDYPVDFPRQSLGQTINNYGPVVTPAKKIIRVAGLREYKPVSSYHWIGNGKVSVDRMHRTGPHKV